MIEIREIEGKGKGVMSTTPILSDTRLGVWCSLKFVEGSRTLNYMWYEHPVLGRYCNHDLNPNTYYKVEDGDIVLYSNRAIPENIEITADYNWAYKLTGYKSELI